MKLQRLWLRLAHYAERVVPGLITCAEAEPFIDDYLDDRLEAGVRRRFERHIAMCPPCRSYLDAYRRSVALTRAGDDAETPAKMPDDLLAAILAARDERER